MASDEGRAFVLLDVLLDDFDAAGERRCRGVDAGDGQRHALQCEDFALTLRIDLNERVFERVSHARGTEGWFFGVLSSSEVSRTRLLATSSGAAQSFARRLAAARAHIARSPAS